MTQYLAADGSEFDDSRTEGGVVTIILSSLCTLSTGATTCVGAAGAQQEAAEALHTVVHLRVLFKG